jgi:hypothetical protein
MISVILWVVGGFFVFMTAWDIKAWWERRRDEQLQAQRMLAHQQYLDSLPEPDPAPPPWVGMSEEYVLNTTWGWEYNTCLETVNETATERSYYFEYRGWLRFRNGTLITITEWR